MAGDTGDPAATSEAVNDDVRDVAAARAGSHEAFARIYDRHAPVVLSLCRRGLYGSLTEAEDATQETFIRAHRLLQKLDDPCRLRPWLYGIAKRVSSERRRSLSRRKNHEDQAMTNATAHPPSSDTAPEIAEQREELARMTQAIDQLDENERLAVHLYYLEADPVGAATSALGLSRSGYYKLLARARERIAFLMREVQPS